MGGNMPFHFEKGAIGLRMDYLCRIPAFRATALAELAAGTPIFNIANNLTVGGVTVSMFGDTLGPFVQKLKLLSGSDKAGNEYANEASLLRPLNMDTPGNRNEFAQFWIDAMAADPTLEDQIRMALIQALESGREVDVWWECSLPDNTPPKVQASLDLPEVARVYFRTDHSPVVPQVPGQQPRP